MGLNTVAPEVIPSPFPSVPTTKKKPRVCVQGTRQKLQATPSASR